MVYYLLVCRFPVLALGTIAHRTMKKPSVFAVFPIFAVFFAWIGLCAGEDATPRIGPATVITIPPDIDYASVANRADMVETLALLPKPDAKLDGDIRFDPKAWAEDVRFTRDIWCLQFRFKPVRVVYVDIPNKEGSFDKKAVWYLVYGVKNLGPTEFQVVTGEKTVETETTERTYETTAFELTHQGSSLGTDVESEAKIPLIGDTTAVSNVSDIPIAGAVIEPLVDTNKRRTTEEQTHDTPLTLRNLQGTPIPRPGKDEPILFEPQFILATDSLIVDTKTENDPKTGRVVTYTERDKISYVDQYIPLAIPVIMKREGMKGIPETTVTFPNKPIASGEERWGVALWTDIDPNIHRFSIFISGLTNAYQWEDDGTNTGKPGEGRSMKRKVLKTNWWRVGDKYTLDDTQIQYGFPGQPGDFDRDNPDENLLRHDFEWLYR